MSYEHFISNIIKNVHSRLKAHEDIVIDEYTVNPPADTTALDSEELVPEILRNFYKVSNGLVLTWHAKSDPLVRGGIVMPLLENIHNTRWKSFGMLDYTDDVHAIFHKKNEFDTRVMMESLEGDEDIEFTELANSLISIEDYFRAFEKTHGFRYWQENYSETIHYTIDSIIENQCYLWGNKSEVTVPELHSAHIPN